MMKDHCDRVFGYVIDSFLNHVHFIKAMVTDRLPF